MLLRRTVTLATALAAACTVLAGPAVADDGEPPTLPRLEIVITFPTATTHQVCWVGRNRGVTLPSSSHYRVAIAGGRVAGAPITYGPQSTSGTSASGCTTISKNGADAGNYYVTFSYDGIGGVDVTSSVVATGLWENGEDTKVETNQ